MQILTLFAEIFPAGHLPEFWEEYFWRGYFNKTLSSFPRRSCTFVRSVRYKTLWHYELLYHSSDMRLPMLEVIFLLFKQWNPSKIIRRKEIRHESEQGKKRKHSRGICNTSRNFILLLMPMILLKLVQTVISSVTQYSQDNFQY